MRKAIGLDLAKFAGWCLGAPDETPLTGTFTLPETGRDVGRYLNAYADWFEMMLDYGKPALVAFEAPFLSNKSNLATSRKLIGLCNVTEQACSRRAIACTEVSVQTARKYFTGRGNAEPAQRIACARMFGVAATNEHEADAFGIWAYSLVAKVPDMMSRFNMGLLGMAARR